MNNVVLEEQQVAPDFTLPAVGNNDIVHQGQIRLSDLKGHIVVLYFYPRDNTSGCTAEACSFRDANQEMQKRGIVVLGVSTDNLAAHQKFAETYNLPFTLLADTDTKVSQLYGVWQEKSMYGRKYMGVNRETFLIDKEGVIRKIWHKVKPGSHASEVLEAIELLQL